MLVTDTVPRLSHIQKKATAIVLYKPRENVPSEFYSITQPNDVPTEVERLRYEYDLQPQQLISPDKFAVFVDPAVYKHKCPQFKQEYRTQNIIPLHVSPGSLTGEEWSLVLCAGSGNEQQYVKRLFQILEKLQFGPFKLEDIRNRVKADERLNKQQKQLAEFRLEILAMYTENNYQIRILSVDLSWVE